MVDFWFDERVGLVPASAAPPQFGVPPMQVRRIAAGEGPRVRALRLRALEEAPHAFASSLELELAHPDEHWEGVARQSEVGDETAVFVAIDAGGDWRAMAGARWFDRAAGVAQLWGMWVEPSARGTGLGRVLVNEIAGWAVERGALRLRLGVIDRAAAAAAFYERLGFARTGETKALPPDGATSAFFLAKELPEPPGSGGYPR